MLDQSGQSNSTKGICNDVRDVNHATMAVGWRRLLM